jgi:hypothetical protein
VKQNPAKLASMQALIHEKVYDFIRDMIDPQPEKRISLKSVVMQLETLFPPSATSSQEYRKDDQPNPKTAITSGDPCETEVEGKNTDVRDQEGDSTNKTRLEEEAEEVKCCIHRDARFKEMEETCEKLED